MNLGYHEWDFTNWNTNAFRPTGRTPDNCFSVINMQLIHLTSEIRIYGLVSCNRLLWLHFSTDNVFVINYKPNYQGSSSYQNVRCGIRPCLLAATENSKWPKARGLVNTLLSHSLFRDDSIVYRLSVGGYTETVEAITIVARAPI